MTSLFRPPESNRSNQKTPKLRLPALINATSSPQSSSAGLQNGTQVSSNSPVANSITANTTNKNLNQNMYNANIINNNKLRINTCNQNNTPTYVNVSNQSSGNIFNAKKINHNMKLNTSSTERLTPSFPGNGHSPYGISPISKSPNSKSPLSLKKRPPPPSLPSLSLNPTSLNNSTSSSNNQPQPLNSSKDNGDTSNYSAVDDGDDQKSNSDSSGKNDKNIINSMHSLTLNTEITSNTSIEDTPIDIIDPTLDMISPNGNSNSVARSSIPYLRKDLNESSDSYFSNIISTYENNSSSVNSPLKTPLSGLKISDDKIALSAILSGKDVDQLDETFWQYKSIKDEIITLGILGEGAGGSVAKCKLRNGKKIFALKTINTLNTEPEFQKQIFRELQFNKSFKSNYIVRYYGMFNDELNSSIYIAMEYMGGKSLEAVYKNLLQRGGRIGEKVLGKIAEDVLKGLSYLHEMKVIHRDIKPQNILFNEDGEVKLCDFGVSGEAVNSLATTFTGTSFYMAPERIQGEPYSVTCDVWSLGLTILEVAQGQFPFGSDKITANIAPIELLVLILTFTPELKDEPESNIIWSKSFKSFIEYCLKKDPRERPSPRQMLKHPWVQGQMKKQVNMTKFIKKCWEA